MCDSLQNLISAAQCRLGEEGVRRNPRFSAMLSALLERVDRTGLLRPLARDFQRAERELLLQRRDWLRLRNLLRVLHEMIRDQRYYSSSSSSPSPSSPADQVCHTLDRCLLVAECVTQMNCCDVTDSDVIEVCAVRVKTHTPPDTEVVQSSQMFPSELLRHLKKTTLHILSYWQPESETDGEGLRMVKLQKLPDVLSVECVKVKRLGERNRDTEMLLQRQSRVYLSELLKCVKVLQTLLLDLRLTTQTELDRKKLQYFQAKCDIVLQKIWAELLELQLDTYSRDKMAAHRRITEKLQHQLRLVDTQRREAEDKLTSFEIYGRDFQALAEEYSRLRREIDIKSWALREFTS